jgi:hypothetical protein
VANGTGGLTVNSKADSLTAATITISAFSDTIGDSLTITVSPANTNAETTTVPALLYLSDTGFAGTRVDTSAAYSGGNDNAAANIVGNQRLVASVVAKTDTVGVTSGVTTGTYIMSVDTQVVASAVANFKASFTLQLDSGFAAVAPGTYSYTLNIRSFDAGAATSRAIQQTLSIVISRTAAQAAAASTAVAATSYVVMSNSSTNLSSGLFSSTTTDSQISVVATASTTDHAVLRVRLLNASSASAQESVTASITAGRIGDGTTMGRSVILPYTTSDYTAGYKDLVVEADGTAGVATITISTPSYTFPTKSVTFYALSPATLTVSVPTTNFKVGSNADSIRVVAKDANGNTWSGALYTYAATAADLAIAGTDRSAATECAFDGTTDFRHECTITGTSAGTATITISTYSSAALATAAAIGAEVSATAKVTVNTNTAATVKLEFDKATYAPNERARIYITPLDSSGKPIASATFTNLLVTGGIATTGGLSFVGTNTQNESLTAVTYTTDANASSSTGAKPGSRVLTVYMPASGGAVTISATGGVGLPPAGRVAVSATATVTDSGTAALAAVSALATTVASLKTLITTLTNLVLKIQKKVKA